MKHTLAMHNSRKGRMRSIMKKKRKWLQILKKRKKFVIPLTIILVAGIGAGIFVMGRGRSMRTMAGAMAAQTAEVTKGNISTTVIGTGNLESADAENVYLPEGVEVEEVLVSSGDHVEEGTVLAKLDAASITTEMLSIQEEISELDEDLNEVKDDTESDTITTKISGRVKEIYAQEGTSVAETMADKGALMVLSVDGKMAVELKNVTTVSLGDTVTVILSDGSTEKEGTVESLEGTTCLVTLTDKGTTLGELVTVQDADGKSLGNGKLTIHQPLEITAVAGTVKSIKVSEGDAVDAGDTLATLKDVPASAEYQELAATREKLTERLKSLIALSKTNTLTAEFSGTVQGVYVSDDSKVESSSSSTSSGTSSESSQGATIIGTRTASASSAVNGNSSSAIFINTGTGSRENSSVVLRTVSTETESEKNLGSAGKSASDVLITSITNVIQAPVSGAAAQTVITQTECTGTVAWTVGSAAFSGSFDQAVQYTAKITLQAAQGYAFATDDSLTVSQDGASNLEWKVTEQTAEITIQFTATAINSCSLTIAAPEAGASPQTAVDGTAAYSGTISWSPQTTVFAASTQYIATVKLNAHEGYRFADTDQMTVTLNGSRVSQVSVSEDASQVTMILVYQIGENGKSEEPSSESQGSGIQQTENSQQKETQQTNGTQQKNENQQTEGQETGKTTISPSAGVTTGGTGSSSAAAGVSGSSGTGSSSSSATSESTQSAQEDVDTTKVTAFTISPEENMNLSVSVDELDILSIALDQKAEITFDAIEDEIFEGTITNISDTASVNGGVAKYTVTITLPKNESMKVGMNASATITIEDKQDILLIPVSALQERGDSVFVYTEQDEESGALSGEVEVETGLSDGSNVEITEGLSEGDVVYYTRTASEEGESGFNMERMEGMGGGRMGDQMPSGSGPSGERPSGGGPGGQ